MRMPAVEAGMSRRGVGDERGQRSELDTVNCVITPTLVSQRSLDLIVWVAESRTKRLSIDTLRLNSLLFVG